MGPSPNDCYGFPRVAGALNERLPMFFRRRVIEKFVASLLVAGASSRGRCSGRCWLKTPVQEYDTVRGNVHGTHLDLPVVALTNINACPMAPDWERFAVFTLPSLTPFCGCPQFVASRTDQVNGIPVQLGDVVFGVPPPVSLDWNRFAVLALPCLTPFSGCPQFVASRTYQVRGIPVNLVDAVLGVPPLVQVCKPFLNGLSTDDWAPIWRNKNRIARI